MTLPHSMDYLSNGGVLNFDAAAYLNGSGVGIQQPQTNLLGGTQLQSQPQNDSFSSKVKAKFKDVNFLKKAATAAIVATLAFVGIKKGKNVLNTCKNSEVVKSTTNCLSSAKNWVVGLFTKKA